MIIRDRNRLAELIADVSGWGSYGENESPVSLEERDFEGLLAECQNTIAVSHSGNIWDSILSNAMQDIRQLKMSSLHGRMRYVVAIKIHQDTLLTEQNIILDEIRSEIGDDAVRFGISYTDSVNEQRVCIFMTSE